MNRWVLTLSSFGLMLGGPIASQAGDLEPPGAPEQTMKRINHTPPVWIPHMILAGCSNPPEYDPRNRWRCIGSSMLHDAETGLSGIEPREVRA